MCSTMINEDFYELLTYAKTSEIPPPKRCGQILARILIYMILRLTQPTLSAYEEHYRYGICRCCSIVIK